MTNNDLEINTLIMREMGLEIGPKERIFDQDTGVAIKINGMDVVAPGCYGGRQSVEFDPHNNKKMMSQLFQYFLSKHSEETDVDVMTYYNVDNGPKGSVECKLSNNETITSASYMKDSLKYTDIMIQLNGDNPPDLSKYDVAPESKNVRRKNTRSGSNAKNKSNSKTAKNS
jgi:hypothetical protein